MARLTRHLATTDTSQPLGRRFGRWCLGAFLTAAGVAHLTSLRQEFLAQVPDWVPLDPDVVVVGSGVVEIALGVGLVALPSQRRLQRDSSGRR